MSRKIYCGVGVDVDAVSSWINNNPANQVVNATNISRGIFGANVGLDRILTLFKKHQILATFFVPAHTLESFPERIRSVVEAGHEIGLHGYSHEFVADLSSEQEAAILDKSFEIVSNFTGKPPRGWTAPAWKTSRDTVNLLEAKGLVYDHSFMHHDCQPYYLPHFPSNTVVDSNLAADEWMKPMQGLTCSSLVEIPANWHLDDWPPLNVGSAMGQGFVDPDVVLKIWKAQFDHHFEHEKEGFIFPITIHPQVSGKPQVYQILDKLIEYINGHEGVEWVKFEEMADRFKKGEIKGFDVTRSGG